MTLTLLNVKEEFLPSVKAFSKAINAKCKVEKKVSTKQEKTNNFIDEMIKDFKKPENYAVFERLKDK